MLHQEFFRNALVAGTFVALACGLTGYFVVLRAQVFAADALSHVAFTGALAAAALGLSIRGGLFAVTIGGGVVLAATGARARADDVTTGSFFAWALGLGVLFLSIFTTRHSSGNGAAGVRVLFGSIFSLTRTDVVVAGVLGAGVVLALLALGRPLLFATVDPDVARTAGVPVRLVGLAFLVLLGVVCAETTQVVGALLLLGLLAAPAGAAQRLTGSPARGAALAVAFAVGSVWAGLALADVIPRLPPSSAIVGVAAAIYLASFLPRALR
jgi:zinc/manganese transport system permease protein